MKNLLRLFIILQLTHAIFAYADEGPVFGPEFTFATEENGGFADTGRVRNRMHHHLITGQRRGCKFETYYEGGNVFVSPNRWSFTLTIDQGVIEVGMKPMTVEQYEKYEADIQDAIFASCANEAHFPYLFKGGGHINVDMHYFDDKPLLFRNFIVDLLNHNELFLGIWGYDTHNALPFDLIDPDDYQGIHEILKKFEGRLRNPNNQMPAAASLASDMYMLGVKSKDPYFRLWHKMGRTRQFALSFMTAMDHNREARLEIRSVRPQDSMQTFIGQIRLIRNRLRYLQKFNEPIALKPMTAILPQPDPEAYKLNPPVNPHEALKNFYVYVRQSGERWQDHRSYLWPQWLSDGTVDDFENSDWFKSQEASTQPPCENLLTKR